MSMARQDGMLRQMESGLHDLCQPLTTLQCRLELGLMCGDDVSLREAVEGALVETARLFQGIEAIRERLLRERVGAIDATQAEGD
jgi:hypothetical protein